jgi:N-acetylglutamate synthase
MPSAGSTSIAELDELVAAAWRAPETCDVDGWQLRFGLGLTGRANSAWPRRHEGAVALDAKITAVESFYRSRGLRPKVQLSPASEPDGLDDELDARGWERSGDVLIEVAAASPAAEADVRVRLAHEPDDTWLDIWLAVRDFPRDRADRLMSMLCGPGVDTVFARLDELAVGRATAHDGSVGITCMATLPGARRRGAGSAVLAALTAWAAVRASRLFLNVDAANGPALALYEQAGFEPLYPYWYRTAPE